MNSLSTLERLEAWCQGRPLPTTETLPWPRVARTNTLVLAFVRMAGESLPWGVAFGHPGEAPTIVTIPEPRNRDLVAQLALRLAPALLTHLGHPAHTAGAPADPATRQLWVPGPTHLDMLHFLAYRFARARKTDEVQRPVLNALGRASGWLFREAQRPGQFTVLDATRCLRETFAFPAEDTRQSHLGFLLAWLRTEGSREARIAAAREAERASVGITLDPGLEADVLESRVSQWNEEPARREETAAEIDAVLRPELLRRWALAVEAFERLTEDTRPVNPRIGGLSRLAREEYQHQYLRFEQEIIAADPEGPQPFVPDPETDRTPAAAAARYFAQVHAMELTSAELVHGDATLVAAAVEAGDAIAGRIRTVRDEGTGRKMIPVWVVNAPAEHVCALREGSEVCVAGLSGRTGVIRSLETAGERRTVTVEIDGWKTARPDEGAPAANDTTLEGTIVALLGRSVVGISFKKSCSVWDAEGPGAWLTHGAAQPPTDPPTRTGAELIHLVNTFGAQR